MVSLYHLPAIKAQPKTKTCRKTFGSCGGGWIMPRPRASPCRLRLLIFLKQVPSHRRLSRCCLISSMISGWIFSLSSLQKNKTTHQRIVSVTSDAPCRLFFPLIGGVPTASIPLLMAFLEEKSMCCQTRLCRQHSLCPSVTYSSISMHSCCCWICEVKGNNTCDAPPPF